jgi:hypothetical protein
MRIDENGAVSFELSITHGDYLLCRAHGRAELVDMVGALELLRVIVHERPYRRVLIDLLDLDVEFTFTQHVAIGMRAGEALAGAEKVASVVPERLRVGTSERAAQRSGVSVRTFTELAEAIAWLETS